MTTSRRSFIRTLGASLATGSAAASALACADEPSGGAGNSESLLATDRRHPEPAPVGVDRLPLAWYQRAATRLREDAGARGVDAVLLQQDPNLVYFTGCFRHSGERTTWALFPVRERDTVYWYSPAIDRDLITSWWCTENDYYFCYPHADGGFPNRGEIARGTRVDLWAWVLGKLAERGLSTATIGIDRELTPSQLATAARVVPRVKFVNIADLCLRQQIIKTPEEIALTQRAYRYFDRIHAFARDFILEHGTSTTDFAVGQALSQFGIGMLMRDVKRDGTPHQAVGIEVTGHYVRAGVATAYPHPNQFFHAPLEKGKPVYVNTDILLGGFGGECYRNYILLPSNDRHDRMWQVVSESVEIMVEATRPGVACSEVAERVHRHQVKAGLQECIYHRPGHGQGQNFVGHQAPFLALGDDTVIEPGMTFSVEPGLYDAAAGIGVNPSDRLVVLEDRSVLMSRVPFTREWSYLAV